MNKYERQELARQKRVDKLTPKIMKEFPWFDSCYLLELMSVWFSEASKKYEVDGCHVKHKSDAKFAKILSELCKRLREDNYSGEDIYMKNVSLEMDKGILDVATGLTTVDFKYFPNKEVYHKQSSLAKKHNEMQRKQDKEMFAKMFNQIERLWD